MIASVGRSRIYLHGAARGLVSEGETLAREACAFGPDVMAIAVSREELEGLLLNLDPAEGSDDFDGMTNYDEEYARHLTRYGDVSIPPADLVEACRYAIGAAIPIRSVDLTEAEMTDASLRLLRPFDTIRYGIVMRNLRGRRFKAEDGRAFAVEWDGAVRRIRRFRALEELRERHIAARLSALARRYERVFAALEVQMLEGIASTLDGRARHGVGPAAARQDSK
ncbi:MAG: hypothetical protein L0Z54_00945 [Thermoplasmata archaeon]|nr:hypothetical protein [Thermoplasmata archaeon]